MQLPPYCRTFAALVKPVHAMCMQTPKSSISHACTAKKTMCCCCMTWNAYIHAFRAGSDTQPDTYSSKGLFSGETDDDSKHTWTHHQACTVQQSRASWHIDPSPRDRLYLLDSPHHLQTTHKLPWSPLRAENCSICVTSAVNCIADALMPSLPENCNTSRVGPFIAVQLRWDCCAALVTKFESWLFSQPSLHHRDLTVHAKQSSSGKDAIFG